MADQYGVHQPTAPASEDLRRVAGRILEHASVADCAVSRRVDSRGSERLVAYVVADEPLTLAELRAHCQAGARDEAPDVVVRVSSIPLSSDGTIDYAALETLPALDSSIADEYRSALQRDANVADVELVVGWPQAIQRGFRFEELLPSWARLNAPARAGRAVDHAVPDSNAPPSLSVGAPIQWGPDRPTRLSDLLARAAATHPANGVTCVDEDGEVLQTYPALVDRAARIMAGLRAIGLRPGDPVLFQFERNQDLIAAFWGCALGGFVPTPIAVPSAPDPTSAAAMKVKNAWQMLGRPRVLTSAALEPRLSRLRELMDVPDLELATVERLQESPSGEAWYEASPNDLALMLLTSGSTGLPKAVTQTQSALVAACAAMSQRNGFTSDDVPINWISLDHVGGIVMCHLMYVMLGSRQVHARTDYFLHDPLRWLDLIDRHGGTFTWAPNFAFALVNDRAAEIATRRWDLSSMRFVLNGGEAVVAQTARRFLRLLGPHGLPATAMHPAWGMSETCSAATFSEPFLFEETSDDNALVEVGPPDPEFEIRIVDDQDAVVPEGVEGRLEVRGPNVTRGYYNNPDANAESFTADGWFKTGDLAKLTGGRMTITGREKGIVIINGVNYYAHEVEAAVEGVPGVTASFAAAFAVREPGAETDALVVVFHAATEQDSALVELMRRIRAAVLERVGIMPRYLLPVAKTDIPKTDIGKIQRPALTKRFQAGGFANELKRVEQLTQRAELVPEWFFRPTWRKRHAVAHRPIASDTVLLAVRDARGVANAIVDAASELGAAASIVERDQLGAAIARVAPTERLVVVVSDDVSASGDISEIDEADVAERSVNDVLWLVRTVTASRQNSARTELIVVESGTQHVRDEDVSSVGKASALAMLRTASAEHAELTVRHIDPGAVDPGVVDPVAVSRIVIAEAADEADESEVAHRDGERWVRRLARAVPTPSTHGHTLGRTDGFYVVTGGLGGVGAEVCRYLLRVGDAPILIVGRTAIARASDEARATLGALRALGEVHFAALDVADEGALERAVSDAEARWNRPLAGVIHLAGVFEPRLMAAETPETLAGAMRAKTRGAWNIHRLLMTRPDAAFVAFSSVNGYFGGYAAGAYAAANAFLDALVEQQARRLGRAAYSLGWSLWSDVGMSREYSLKNSAARRGYRAVGVQPGIVSLVASVAGEPGQMLIGLDGDNPQIRRRVDGPIASDVVTAYLVRSNGGDPLAVASSSDAFGTPIPFEIREVPDLTAIRSGGRNAASGERGAGESGGATFGNDLERAIAAVLKAVLPGGDIGPNDNFFDLGVNSLVVATACRKLQESLGRDVPLTDIYRFPTLRLLAQHYGGDDADVVALDDSEERGQARRAKRLQRRRRDS